jgi:hypothetical protein
LVCDEVHVDRSSLVDIPNVVVNEEDAAVKICGSGSWNLVNDLPSVFVGILSHESIHLTLLKIDGDSSDYLDEVASLSSISMNLKSIPLVRKYSHGMIGFDL